MRLILKLILLIVIFNFTYPMLRDKFNDASLSIMINQFQSTLNSLQNNQEIKTQIKSLNEKLQLLWIQIEDIQNGHNTENPSKEIQVEKIALKPLSQLFSIRNIELGENKEEVERKLGTPQRVTLNEYGENWYTYHHQYKYFTMVLYDQHQQVAGLYTNQDLIASTTGITLGSSKEVVQQRLGSPLTKVQKGLFSYQLEKDAGFDLFLQDDVYITLFYDKHQNNKVTSIQLIKKEIEQLKTDIYPKVSNELKEGFEYQLFDLTNAARLNHNLSLLTWDEHVRETARKHSDDMALNDYFSHTNLEGESPFDRMEEDDLLFHMAGENLAYGQFSSIFAHEGLMNSIGHRKNILQKDYEYLGVGVAFNQDSKPYFTQNFFAK
jgi:uncharacterized protein YkwD